VPTKAEVTRKLLAAKEGKEGTPVSDTPSTEVYGWLFEAGASGDLHKASDAFKRAAANCRNRSDHEFRSGPDLR
jgi:hypothetical protein